MAARHFLATAMLVAALSGCGEFSLDGATAGATIDTAPRPAPDERGLITYPTYQVAVARAGDTVTDVAQRVGVPAEELARFNGIPDGVPLRSGELLVLPGAAGTSDGSVDVASVAGSAIDRAGSVETRPLNAVVETGPEPVRHRVEAGETAFSIARRYGVTPAALAEWNALDSDFNVRAGQLLLIPVAAAPAAVETAAVAAPGQGSVAPEPPSAAAPLPDDVAPKSAEAPPQPNLAEERSDTARLLTPVAGPVVRAYKKGQNEGIDISASAGTPVRAADAGTVAAITRDTNQVPIVVLKHAGNLLTVYAGVDDLAVKKGDKVKRGETIAKVSGGNPSFLHFEVRESFESVDPMQYLN